MSLGNVWWTVGFVEMLICEIVGNYWNIFNNIITNKNAVIGLKYRDFVIISGILYG